MITDPANPPVPVLIFGDDKLPEPMTDEAIAQAHGVLEVNSPAGSMGEALLASSSTDQGETWTERAMELGADWREIMQQRDAARVALNEAHGNISSLKATLDQVTADRDAWEANARGLSRQIADNLTTIEHLVRAAKGLPPGG